MFGGGQDLCSFHHGCPSLHAAYVDLLVNLFRLGERRKADSRQPGGGRSSRYAPSGCVLVVRFLFHCPDECGRQSISSADRADGIYTRRQQLDHAAAQGGYGAAAAQRQDDGFGAHGSDPFDCVQKMASSQEGPAQETLCFRLVRCHHRRPGFDPLPQWFAIRIEQCLHLFLASHRHQLAVETGWDTRWNTAGNHQPCCMVQLAPDYLFQAAQLRLFYRWTSLIQIYGETVRIRDSQVGPDLVSDWHYDSWEPVIAKELLQTSARLPARNQDRYGFTSKRMDDTGSVNAAPSSRFMVRSNVGAIFESKTIYGYDAINRGVQRKSDDQEFYFSVRGGTHLTSCYPDDLRHQPHFKAYLALISVCFFWGTTYLGIRMALESFPPMLLVCARYIISGSLMLGVLLARGTAMPQGRELVTQCFSGILILGVGNGCLTLAELRIPSGLAGLILTMSPFWMVGIEALLPGGERLHPPAIFGMTVGLVGAALLLAPGFTAVGLNRLLLEGFLILQVGMISWSFGSIYQRRQIVETHPVVVGVVQQLAAGLSFLPLSILFRGSPIHWTSRGTLAILYLVIFGSIVGYSSYAYALNRLPVAIVSIYPYVNALVAVALGWLFYREPFGFREASAMLIIFIGVGLVKWHSRHIMRNKISASGIEAA